MRTLSFVFFFMMEIGKDDEDLTREQLNSSK